MSELYKQLLTEFHELMNSAQDLPGAEIEDFLSELDSEIRAAMK